MPAYLVAAVFVTTVLLVGCRSVTRLDARALEGNLPGQVVGDHPELLTEVSCPSPIVKRRGVVTVCQAKLDDTPVQLTVTQGDDNGAVSVALDKPLLDVVKSVAVLASRFTKDLSINTTIECDGAAVRVLVVGETLQCTAHDPSLRSRTLVVTVLDEQGTLDASLR